jgi:hypothetical protein
MTGRTVFDAVSRSSSPGLDSWSPESRKPILNHGSKPAITFAGVGEQKGATDALCSA